MDNRQLEEIFSPGGTHNGTGGGFEGLQLLIRVIFVAFVHAHLKSSDGTVRIRRFACSCCCMSILHAPVMVQFAFGVGRPSPNGSFLQLARTPEPHAQAAPTTTESFDHNYRKLQLRVSKVFTYPSRSHQCRDPHRGRLMMRGTSRG